MDTIKIFLSATKEEENKDSKTIDHVLKSGVYRIPSNVIDSEYFEQSVQVHYNRFALLVLNGKLAEVEQQLAECKEEEVLKRRKKEDSRNDLLRTLHLFSSKIEEFNKELEQTWGSSESAIEEMNKDHFARSYALVIGDFVSYKKKKTDVSESSKVEFETINFRFKDQDKTGTYLAYFNDGYSQEDRKTITGQIATHATNLFATNGGAFYKSINFLGKFTTKKVNDELYARSKALMKLDSKGKGIQGKAHDDFVMTKQLFLLCLHYLGLPIVTDSNTILVTELARNDNSINLARPGKSTTKGNSNKKK